MNKWLKALLYLLGAAFLTRLIPFSSWFRMLDTMIHEFGHAIATLLVSGRVLRIELYPDHSGVTYSVITSGWSQLIVSLAGYFTASLFAVALFYSYSRQKQGQGLMIITALALVSGLLFVRNGYGLIWLLIFIALNLLFLVIGGRIRSFYYLLLAFLCLEESVMAPLTLLLLAVSRPGSAGDAANLAALTGVPAIVWALLFFAIAVLCARVALNLYWNRKAANKAPQMSFSPYK
ncbi:M50 family metallopeptidase [Paenibacillus brevis]|uniref:M50 family metallopeptidase n=1 Tax=Paenibacillus brevis TaxID=2841508 RepID=A0ABS6FQB4_9BACL|nr:M50 family metallopeptidase [Paenibacillus brevis]MBU5672213.1 M50 family metallopeptidase [Paenibacillus brevis]